MYSPPKSAKPSWTFMHVAGSTNNEQLALSYSGLGKHTSLFLIIQTSRFLVPIYQIRLAATAGSSFANHWDALLVQERPKTWPVPQGEISWDVSILDLSLAGPLWLFLGTVGTCKTLELLQLSLISQKTFPRMATKRTCLLLFVFDSWWTLRTWCFHHPSQAHYSVGFCITNEEQQPQVAVAQGSSNGNAYFLHTWTGMCEKVERSAFSAVSQPQSWLITGR